MIFKCVWLCGIERQF